MAEPYPGFAPAKVNLTLHVTGQRADGLHLLDSLVVFVDCGDRVGLAPPGDGLTVSGPFARDVPMSPDNLVLRAKELIAPDRQIGIHLEKNLPPASGIGGGSSDAAAALRLLAREFDLPMPSVEDALSLGADLPICITARTCRMSGIGENVAPIDALPELHLVLVNPGVAISTPEVFQALQRKQSDPMSDIPTGADLTGFCDWLRQQRNDLETPAIALAPVVENVLNALSATDAFCARMSGSGATCFGVYGGAEQASRAAEQITASQPDWWVVTTKTI